MNKLVFPNGGVPLQGDDFMFMQNALRDAINGVMKQFTGDYYNAIIWGCKHSTIGNTMSVSEGYVMIDGELCYCPAQSVPYNTSNELYLNVSYDPTGNETSANGGTIQCYEVRIAKLGLNPNQAFDPIIVIEDKRIEKNIIDKLKPYVTKSFNAFSFLNNVTNNDLVLFEDFNRVTLEGGVNCSLNFSTGWKNIIQLPPAYFPTRPIYNSIIIHEQGTYYNAICKIETNGIIKVDTPINQIVENIYLDGVTFII